MDVEAIYPLGFIIRSGNLELFFFFDKFRFIRYSLSAPVYVASSNQFQLFTAGVAEVVLSGFLPHVVECCVTVIRIGCRSPETDSLTPVMEIAYFETPKQIILLYSLKT